MRLSLGEIGKRRRDLAVAVAIWYLLVVVIAVMNGILRYGGVLMSPSISMYVGYEAWSVGLFVVMNSTMVWLMGRYLAGHRKRMGRAWWVLLLVMLGSFVMVSVLPWGFYDDGSGWVSVTHRVMAYVMFFVAVPFVGLSMRGSRGNRDMTLAGWVFLGAVGLLAVMFVVELLLTWTVGGEFGLPWSEILLLVEGGYIGMIFVVVLCVRGGTRG